MTDLSRNEYYELDVTKFDDLYQSHAIHQLLNEFLFRGVLRRVDDELLSRAEWESLGSIHVGEETP